MDNIDHQETLLRYGYSPENLRPSSCKSVVCYCSICGCERIKDFRSAKKQTKCLQCSNKINANTNIEARSNSMAEWYKTNEHPRLGSTHTDEVRKILSDSAKRRTGKLNPNYGRKQTHGKGQYYTKLDGSQVWMRSRWEVSTAHYFDEIGILWEYEPQGFEIAYWYNNEEKEGVFWPDFYLVELNEWWEIKGWWRDNALAKYNAFVQQYSSLNILLMAEKDLKALGIKTRWWRKDDRE